MNSKIGLVTWYNLGYNYGTMLQAFATSTFLVKNGFMVDIIDLKKGKKQCFKMRLINFYLYFFNHKIFKRNINMKKWIDQNLEVKIFNSYEDLKKFQNNYFAFVCGSDQIWNNNNGKVNPFYYLQFAPYNKRIAYAPSIGREFIPDDIQEEFAKYVKEIKYLSIREKKGAEIINKLTGIKCPVYADPTLLLCENEWINILKLKKTKEDKYIFVYLLNYNVKLLNEIKSYAKSVNVKIKYYVPKSKSIDHNLCDDPFTFLQNLYNSSYVITDSYHGMLFSINFNKEFLIFKRFSNNDPINQNSRVFNILNEFKLGDRLLDNNNFKISFSRKIDYDFCNSILNEKRKESMKFLLNSINKIKSDGDI